MTERSFGSTFKWFVAKVVNRGDGKKGEKDKTESGRVQIRIYGKHDDEKNIPDDALPWAIPMMPINAGAGRNGVSGTPAGLLNDSQVVGFYADEDEEIPILMGVLLRSGRDADQSPDAQGEDVDAQRNDAPKGSRTSDTAGSDKNDVLKTNNSLVSDVASTDQLHNAIPTIGSAAYDGSPVLDAINKADPQNLSGSIPGAVSAMKSMTSTLNVASSLLSNFSALTSIPPRINMLDLLRLSAGAMNLKNYRPSVLSNQFNVATNFSVAAAGANIASNLIRGAFSGGNPLEGIISGLGGLQGLAGLAGKATTMLGPISGNFGAASAISSTLKGMGQAALGNLVPARIPTPFGQGMQVPNLSGSTLEQLQSLTGGQAAIAGLLRNSPLSALGLPAGLTGAIPIKSLTSLGSQLLGSYVSQNISLSALNGSSIGLPVSNVLRNVSIESGIGIPYSRTPIDPGSFNNSTISLPSSLSLRDISGVRAKNGSIGITISNSISPYSTRSSVYDAYSSEVIPDVTFASQTYDSSYGLNNSYISVSIPQGLTSYSIKQTLNRNPGVNYSVHGSVFKVNKAKRTVRR